MAPQSTSPSSPSLISMRELDPSPVDSPLPSPELSPPPSSDTSPEENRNEKRPTTSPPSRSSSSSSTFLGLPKPSLTTTLLALQKYSMIPFTLFLGLHITNTSLLPLFTSDSTLQKSDTYLLLTRPYYQSQPFETLLILTPLATHILSGLALRLHRRRLNVRRHGAESREDRRRIPWPKVSGQSALGYVLVPLLAGHTLVNRVLPLWVRGDSSGVGLRFVAHGFAKHALIANLGYAMLVGVGSWHVVAGAAKWLRVSEEFVSGDGEGSVREKRRRRRKWLVNGVAGLVAGVWMLGGLGVVGRAGRGLGMGWEVRTWDEIYRSVPVFGGWL